MENQTVNMGAIVDSPNIVCECGCKTFIEGAVLKKVSQIISPTGREEVMPIPVFVCSECGKVPKYYTENPNYSRIFGESNDNGSEENKQKSSLILNT